MKRYFEIIGQRQTLKLEVYPPTSTASVEKLSQAMKLNLRELTRKEYRELSAKYSR